uniref:Uncharacterized protein n=1 Tax=Rhizophora mucronata TaxID=61149 RepID=A0A2P2QLJ4_RHIMU
MLMCCLLGCGAGKFCVIITFRLL